MTDFCSRCERDVKEGRSVDGAPILGRDFCGWCARPVTPEGEALAPLEGFKAAARMLLRAGRTWGGGRAPVTVEEVL